jgi:hypothetical protein
MLLETLNAMLDAEDAAQCGAKRYEILPPRRGLRGKNAFLPGANATWLLTIAASRLEQETTTDHP